MSTDKFYKELKTELEENSIDSSIFQSILDNFSNLDILNSWARSLETSVFSEGIEPYVDELDKWEAALVTLLGLQEDYYITWFYELEELLKVCSCGSSAAQKALEVVDNLTTEIQRLEVTGGLFKVYLQILDKNGMGYIYKNMNYLYEKYYGTTQRLNEAKTSLAIKEIGKRLENYMYKSENLDIFCSYLKKVVGRTSNSLEGIVSDDTAIAKIGERLETDSQFYKMLVAACNWTKEPKQALKFLKSNPTMLNSTVKDAIKIGNLRTTQKKFDLVGYLEAEIA